MIAKNSRTAFVAVLPRPVKEYDEDYFARIVDILNKALEQFQQPREATLSRLVVTDFGDQAPLDPNCPGEVYIKDCPPIGAQVLALEPYAITTIDAAQGDRAAPGNVVLTVDPTWVTIPGCSLTLTKPGRYLLTMNVTFVQSGAGDVGHILRARFTISGGTVERSNPPIEARFYVTDTQGATTSGGSVSQQSMIDLNSGNAVLGLEATKDSGASGQSYISGDNTFMSAVWVSSVSSGSPFPALERS